MSNRGKLLLAIYVAFSSPFILLGFAGLFSRKMGFRIPIVSSQIIPALNRHAVWGETLRGKAILLDGADWFFMIMVGVVILIAVIMLVINALINAAQIPPADSRKKHR
jgi:hypothetical protein